MTTETYHCSHSDPAPLIPERAVLHGNVHLVRGAHRRRVIRVREIERREAQRHVLHRRLVVPKRLREERGGRVTEGGRGIEREQRAEMEREQSGCRNKLGAGEPRIACVLSWAGNDE